MADFSHYKFSEMETIELTLSRQEAVTDEALFKALRGMSPPILAGKEQKYVEKVLGNKRGARPRLDISVGELAAKVSKIERTDTSPQFLQAVAERLGKTAGVRQASLDLAFMKRRERDDRRFFVRAVYYRIYDQLDEADIIEDDILGILKVPQGKSSRHNKALTMLRDFLDEEEGSHPPSKARLMNIVSGH